LLLRSKQMFVCQKSNNAILKEDDDLKELANNLLKIIRDN
ncbi:6257_t:CDS:1, partial [Dentiscutata erythropus]